MCHNALIFVYIVTCDGGTLGHCFYIGTWGGYNPKTRFLHHKSGHGSKFCNKYKPISFEVHGRYPSEKAMRLENTLTCDYIRKYGFRRVRGGNMLNMKPDCYQITALRWWLDGRLQTALECGLLGTPDRKPRGLLEAQSA